MVKVLLLRVHNQDQKDGSRDMKWRQYRQSTNVIDSTDDPPPQWPDGVKMTNGEIYHKPKNETVKVNKDVEFNPDDSKEMAVVRELAKKQSEGKIPIPTPRPSPKSKTHDNLVTPGKWKTKNKI